MRKDLLYLTIILIFIIVLIILINNLKDKNINKNVLKYPGKGLPIISKSQPIELINSEIFEAFANKSNVEIKNGKIYFIDIPNDIEFISTSFFPEHDFEIKLDFLIENGELYISIGNIEFIISRDAKVKMDNRVIHIEHNISKENYIILSTWKKPTVMMLEFAKNIRTIQYPAKVKIKIRKGTKGWIGPWFWVRGET